MQPVGVRALRARARAQTLVCNFHLHALTPSHPNPSTPQALEYSIPNALDGSFVAEKTPPIVIGSLGQVIATTTAGGVLQLANPDTQASEWTSGNPSVFNYSGAIDLSSDSFCYDAVITDDDNVFFATENRNQLFGPSPTSYLHSVNLRTQEEVWTGAPPTLGSNLRVLETNHMSLLDAGGQIWVGTISSHNFPTGMTAVAQTPDATAIPLCMWNSTSVPQPAGDLPWQQANCAGSMMGSAWLPSTANICSTTTDGCVVALNLYTPWDTTDGLPSGPVKTVAMFAYDPNAIGPSPGTTPMWSSKARFTASQNNPNPVVDKWTSKIYWASINEKLLDIENPYQLYCIDGMLELVNGQAQNCAGYGNGLQDGISFPDLWPYVKGAATPGPYAMQWLYAPAVVPNVAITGVDRLLFSNTLNGLLELTSPIGCVFTVSTTG